MACYTGIQLALAVHGLVDTLFDVDSNAFTRTVVIETRQRINAFLTSIYIRTIFSINSTVLISHMDRLSNDHEILKDVQ